MNYIYGIIEQFFLACFIVLLVFIFQTFYTHCMWFFCFRFIAALWSINNGEKWPANVCEIKRGAPHWSTSKHWHDGVYWWGRTASFVTFIYKRIDTNETRRFTVVVPDLCKAWCRMFIVSFGSFLFTTESWIGLHGAITSCAEGDPIGILWKCLMLVKLEWLGCRTMKKKLWRYVKPFPSDTGT